MKNLFNLALGPYGILVIGALAIAIIIAIDLANPPKKALSLEDYELITNELELFN
jgi:hypothetical protein